MHGTLVSLPLDRIEWNKCHRFFGGYSDTQRVLVLLFYISFQELLCNPSMIFQYSHIILDEIHDRSVEADLVLITVRKLMAASTPLKVVIMSATLDCKAITEYFGETMDSNVVADGCCGHHRALQHSSIIHGPAY